MPGFCRGTRSKRKFGATFWFQSHDGWNWNNFFLLWTVIISSKGPSSENRTRKARNHGKFGNFLIIPMYLRLITQQIEYHSRNLSNKCLQHSRKMAILGTIHKRRRQFFQILTPPLPHVGSFLALSVGNFDLFLTPPTPSQLLTSFMDGPLVFATYS